MPYTDVYITNGGYGGIMLGIKNELPLVVAGVHEGKNEICARVGYFKLGVNLKTEKPSPSQLKKAVEEVFANNSYKKNVSRLAKEFAEYNSNEIISEFAAQEIAAYAAYKSKDELQEKIY
jgi:UDP:flavonoid glycosyltransferase YjiC (YdhE family)